MVITTALITGMDLSITLLIISYLIPLTVYGFDHYQDMDKDKETNPERATYFKKKSKIYPYILGSYVVTLIFMLLFLTNWMMVSFITTLMIGSILYPLGLKKLTKRIPAFKNMFTTFIWALAGAFSLVFFNMIEIQVTYILVFIFLYMRMLPNTIFFDMKDIENDAKEKLKTIPVILGKQNALKFLIIFNILSFIPLSIGIYLKIFPLYTIFMIFFLFYSIFYLNQALKTGNKEINKKYYLISDTEFILWPTILLIGIVLI